MRTKNLDIKEFIINLITTINNKKMNSITEQQKIKHHQKPLNNYLEHGIATFIQSTQEKTTKNNDFKLIPSDNLKLKNK
jgi:hypothetical protein